MLRSNTMRDKFSVQVKTEAVNDIGERSTTWAHSFYEWGELKQPMGSRYYQSQQIQSSITHEIRLRSNNTSNSLISSPSDYRVVYNSTRYLYPVSVTLSDRRDYMQVMCKEDVE